ncbi:MAG: transglycosylase SLT domain-containing protein [Oligoflexia bacterium]|nr:transglycosylase SLT domain-containing protein [Oligoflexia bacterium]
MRELKLLGVLFWSLSLFPQSMLIENREYRKALDFVSSDEKIFNKVPKYYGPDITNVVVETYSKTKKRLKKQANYFKHTEPRFLNGRNMLLGYLYWLNREYDLAEEYFKSALSDNLNIDEYIYSFIASCERKKADRKGVFEWNERIIKLYDSGKCRLCNREIVIEAFFENGEIEVMDGKCARGIEYLDKFVSFKSSSPKKPLALFLKARCFEKQKLDKEAVDLYKQIWIRYYNSEISGIALEGILKKAGMPSFDERIRHIKNLARIDGHRKALPELEKLKELLMENPGELVGQGMDITVAMNRINYEIGLSFFMLQKYELAKEILRELSTKGYNDENTLYHLAMCYRKLGDYSSSYAVLSKLYASWPRGRRSAYYLYLMGLSKLELGDFQSAKDSFKTILEKHKRSRTYDDAFWLIGFGHYLRGELDEAVRYFSEYHEKVDEEVFSYGKALYWMARSYIKLGQKGKAVERYRELIRKYPFSYYTWMALSRLKTNKEVYDELASYLPERHRVGECCENSNYDFESKLNNVEHYYRANFLRAVGLKKQAIFELNRLYRKNTRKKDILKSIAELLYSAGDHYTPFYIISIYYSLDNLLGNIAEHQPELSMLFPRVYSKRLRKYALEYSVPELLAMSVIKSESSFREQIVSSAGAVGLMQLMPSTASKVWAMIGMKGFDESMLEKPDTNIRLGTYYLKKLLSEFRGNVPLAVASYNAGPHKVTQWIKSNNTDEMDEFIEQIPYLETLKYVKKVLSYYGGYIYLNEPEGRLLQINTGISDELQIGPFPQTEIW